MVLATLVCLIVSLAVGVGAASAYSLEGPIWSGQPGSGCCAYLTYRNFAGDSKDFNAGTEGTNAWTSISANVAYSLSNTPDIDFEEANDSGAGWDGLTSWTTYTGGNGVVYFQSGMTVQVNNFYLKTYSAAKAQSVSAHEFGHALGLGHHSACVLMNPYTDTRYSSGCGYIKHPKDRRHQWCELALLAGQTDGKK